MDDALLKGYAATKVAEALANYALADEPLSKSPRWKRRSRPSGADYFERDDRRFWHRALNKELPPEVGFYCAALTEWVARIPGLYFHEGSSQRRTVDLSHVLFRTEQHVTYDPPGKSQVVLGGIGTLKLPPAEDGYRLVTLSSNFNASTGVPALVSPDVWDTLKLAEGCVLRISQAPCRDMPLKWAKSFPSTSGIRRPCVVLDDVAHIEVFERKAPIVVHPFAVMEYQEGDAQFHDFVFVTVNTREKTMRRGVTKFFENYRKDRGREGIYLTSADIVEPMWEATFADPSDMRQTKAPQLRLIQQRVEETVAGEDVTAALIRKLCSLSTPSDLKHLSEKAGIPYRRWWVEGRPLADVAQRLVDAAIHSGKQLALLQVVHQEFAS